jgi:ABC-type phosphate/phosphonate transport system ATPase subunit
MEAFTVTKIGATTYTVERVFLREAKESALQALRRLLLQKAKAESQEKLSGCYQNSLAACETVWLYGRNAGKEE